MFVNYTDYLVPRVPKFIIDNFLNNHSIYENEEEFSDLVLSKIEKEDNNLRIEFDIAHEDYLDKLEKISGQKIPRNGENSLNVTRKNKDGVIITTPPTPRLLMAYESSALNYMTIMYYLLDKTAEECSEYKGMQGFTSSGLVILGDDYADFLYDCYRSSLESDEIYDADETDDNDVNYFLREKNSVKQSEQKHYLHDDVEKSDSLDNIIKNDPFQQDIEAAGNALKADNPFLWDVFRTSFDNLPDELISPVQNAIFTIYSYMRFAGIFKREELNLYEFKASAEKKFYYKSKSPEIVAKLRKQLNESIVEENYEAAAFINFLLKRVTTKNKRYQQTYALRKALDSARKLNNLEEIEILETLIRNSNEPRLGKWPSTG